MRQKPPRAKAARWLKKCRTGILTLPSAPSVSTKRVISRPIPIVSFVSLADSSWLWPTTDNDEDARWTEKPHHGCGWPQRGECRRSAAQIGRHGGSVRRAHRGRG